MQIWVRHISGVTTVSFGRGSGHAGEFLGVPGLQRVKAPLLTAANIVHSTSKTGSTPSLTDASIFASFAAKRSLDCCRKGRIGGVTDAGYLGADFSGLASRNAGLWVVGAPRWRKP